MNAYLGFFLIAVSIFAFNTFCMKSSNLGPPSLPPPENVEFGDCFVVPEIISAALSTELYKYHHVCPVKIPDDEPPQNGKVWYVVGSLKSFVPQMAYTDEYDYMPIVQSTIKFIFLRENIVEFVIGTADLEFQIIFQSLQQGQAFYKIVYRDVDLSPAAPKKIRVLSRIAIRENKKIDNNLEALREKINEYWRITFKNERGEPLLVFSQNEAAITKPRSVDKQLLLLVHATHYILTFSSNAEAEEFSDALLKNVEELKLDDVFASIRTRFEDNRITIDS